MIRDAHWLINEVVKTKKTRYGSWASLFTGKVCYLARHPLSP
jgi:hypothetical protein